MTERQIRDHIDALAEPLSLDEIIDSSVLTRVVPTNSVRRARPWAIGAVLIAVLGLGGLAFIASRPNDSVASEASTVGPVQTIGSVPSEDGSTSIGVEQPLVETALTGVLEVAKPGSAHAFSVEGHPPVLLWTTLMPSLQTGHVEEWQCVSEAGGSGCGSTSIPAQFSQTSSIDNQVASDDLFTWSNLPADVDIVRYDDTASRLWQRPVAGLAIFRVDPDHPHPTITAYDSTGSALPYSFWDLNPPLTPLTETTDASITGEPADPAVIGDLFGELQTLTQTSTHDCLTANGATWTVLNVPTFADGVDPGTVWESCVRRVQSIVAARLAEGTTGT